MPTAVLVGCLAALAVPIGDPAGAAALPGYAAAFPGYLQPGYQEPGYQEPPAEWREAPPGRMEPAPGPGVEPAPAQQEPAPAPGVPGNQQPAPVPGLPGPPPGAPADPGVPGGPPVPGVPGGPAPGAGAVPSTDPGARPSTSPSARPKGTPRPMPPTPPSVSMAVTGAGSGTPAYRIQVRNPGRTPLETTVRQTLPRGSSATSISDGGRVTQSTDRATPNEVTWRVTVPAASTTTLRAAVRPGRAGQSVVTPACVYARTGGAPYACATATWQPSIVATDDAGQPEPWRRPAVLGGVLLALLALGVGTPWWWRRHRRRPGYPPTAVEPIDPAAAERAQRGTVYPLDSAPRPAGRRRRPPVWLVVTTALALLVGLVGAGAWAATTRVSAMQAGPQPTSGAWVGQGAAGAVGSTLRETSFEFTVYRLACPPNGTRRQCEAIVGVRNLTPEKQPWHSELQRAYLPGGTWVGVDESATRIANQGRDVFSTPVPAGGRLLTPLVFTIDSRRTPSQLELRSGVFSAGVRINVT